MLGGIMVEIAPFGSIPSAAGITLLIVAPAVALVAVWGAVTLFRARGRELMLAWGALGLLGVALLAYAYTVGASIFGS